ncbi:MAG: hypothetical protein H0W15_03595, partial [Gemmatimonadales bacterium]|nr:hypothetical protein [Gemmatimonadales bacterium]
MITDRELWQRARPVFDELIELGHGPRLERLEAIGRTDSQLRDAVEWLLSADADADAALRDYQFGMPRDASSRTTTSRDPLG